MSTNPPLKSCPICEQAAFSQREKTYHCQHCQFSINLKRPLFKLLGPEKYLIETLGEDYNLAATSLIGQKVTLAELKQFREHVYPDHTLTEFATGNYENIVMPNDTLAQILLEQLRETCYLQINGLKRGQGPALERGGDRFPQGKAPQAEITWQDQGNLFLTNVRLVLPSDKFTFIRLDRRVTSLKTFEDGIALQERGTDKATYFVGCQTHQAALLAAYITGKISSLR